MTPKFVQHDGERWLVLAVSTLDDEPAYDLERKGKHGNTSIAARQSECIPDDKPRKRRFKDDAYVLEFDSRGTVTIREARRRKRFTTSLAAIYSMTVAAAARHERKAPARVRRGLLRR